MDRTLTTTEFQTSALTLGSTLLMALLFAALLVTLVVLAIRRQSSAARMIIVSLAVLLAGIPVLGGSVWLSFGYDSLAEAHEITELAVAPRSSDSPIVSVGKPLVSPAGNSIEEQAEADTKTLVYPPGRPPWVSDPQSLAAAAETLTVSSDPFQSRTDAFGHLRSQLTAEVSRYASERVGDTRAGEIMATHAVDWQQLLGLNTSTEFPPLAAGEGKLSGNVYLERVAHPQPVGDMYRAHAQLIITPQLLQFIDTHWQAAQARERLTNVSLAAGSVVLLLLLLSAGLRVGPRVAARHRAA